MYMEIRGYVRNGGAFSQRFKSDTEFREWLDRHINDPNSLDFGFVVIDHIRYLK